MLVSLLAALLLLARVDQSMTNQEKKDTGVHKLSTKERKNLSEWIAKNYGTSPAPATKKETSQLQENLQSGTYVQLANGTTWKIHPDDRNVAQGWITPVDVEISTSPDPEYPYILTNSVTHSQLRAQKVAKVSSEKTPRK